jgi:hypothetical protein
VFRPRKRYVEEPLGFVHILLTASIHPCRDKDNSELQTFRCVHCHDLYAIPFTLLLPKRTVITSLCFDLPPRTEQLGKLIDDKFNPLELVATVLYCCPKYKDNGTPEFGFYTKRMKLDGIEIPAKSPDGMFEEEFIPNDLNIVINKMNEFYN